MVCIAGVDGHGNSVPLSVPDALDMKRRLHSVTSVGFYRETISNLAEGPMPIVAHVLEADSDLFRVMGVRMARGRSFGPDADEPGHSCEVVISWPFWKRQFGGLAVVGKTVRLSEERCVIDGVLPQGLDLPAASEIWRPVQFDLQKVANGRAVRSLYAVARLGIGQSAASLNAELAGFYKQLGREYPTADADFSARAVLLRDWLDHDVERSVWILFAAVTAVLLIACANVANLLLARSSARLREVAVRVALGASRWSLFQQLLTESLMLALISSLSGLGLAAIAVRGLRSLPNNHIPRPESLAVDWRVVGFALFVAGLTGILFGMVPALRVSLTSLTGVLGQAGGRIGDTRRQQLIRKLLVSLEAAAATVLLVASLLLLKSFNEVSNIDPGFQTDHLLTAYLSLPVARYGGDKSDSARLAQRIVQQLKGIAGIEGATVTTDVPLQTTAGSSPVQIEGSPVPVQEDAVFVLNTGVSPSFRQTLGIPLLAGRDLKESDDREDASAILVNRRFAKEFFPNQNAVGKRLRYNPNVKRNAKWLEIVGVIGDVRQEGLERVVQPELYMPLWQSTNMFPAVIIRTASNPALDLRDIEDAVHKADPEIPVFLPRTMEEVERRRLVARTFTTSLLTGFACVAVLLACGGVFAVIAYSVSQRTSEIGVRIACGATPGNIVGMIAQQGMMPALAGILAGVAAAMFLNRYLTSLLFGVKSTDPEAYTGAVLLLAAFCLLAAWLPARRAARIQPWRALRYE